MTSETQEEAIAEGRRLYGAKQFKPALKYFTRVCVEYMWNWYQFNY